MKRRISVILCLVLVLALSVALLTSCGSNIKAGEANTDVKDGYNVNGKFKSEELEISAKYFTDGGYIALAGDRADRMMITGSKGIVKEVNLQKMQDKIKVDKENIKIVGVAPMAFSNNRYLETVDLTNKEMIDAFIIMDNAFAACPNLTTVKLPEKVHTYGNPIANGAFAYNVKLNSVSGLEKFSDYGDAAFAGCMSLKSIDLSTKTTDISDNMFTGCMSLTTVNNLTNVESIGTEAFANTSVTGIDFSAMSNLKTISNSAFFNAKLTTVKLPDSIESYAERSFVNNPVKSVDVPFIGRLGNVSDSIFDYFGYNANPTFDGPDYVAPEFSLNIRKAVSIDSRMFYNRGDNTNKLTQVSITLLPNGYYEDIDVEIITEDLSKFLGQEYEMYVGQVATYDLVDKIAHQASYNYEAIMELAVYGRNSVRLDKQDQIEVTPGMYASNPDIKSFKVNGVEKYVAPDPVE